MLATEEFFKKKQASSSGSNGAGSSGMATDEFFKKKQQEKSITKQPETSVQPPAESVDINLDEMKKGVVLPSFGVSQPDTAYSGQGTNSMGQGVKIDQTPFRIEQKKKDEEIRTKQNDLIKNAQAFGQTYIEKLKPDEKELLISGLERKKAEQPVLRAATENDLSFEEYTQSNHFATLPEEKKLEILNNQAKDPYNPDNWAFFEKQKKNFDTTYEGKTIQADIKTMQDDPVENIDIALNIGRDQVFQTIGAIGEWAGVSDGTFRKMAEKNSEWESVRFNQEMGANDNNILDSRFWTQKVPQSIPFMVALAPSQIAGAAAGGSLATVAGLGTLGKFLLQSGLAGLSSRMTESLAEGADTYATLVDNGATEEEASTRAWGTTKGNMALAFSDMTQMAVTFAPVGKLFPKVPGGAMTKFLVPAGKFVFDGASEGGEEVFQGYVQQYNVAKGLGQEPMSVFEYLQTPEALNAFSLGAASGMMFGGIGVAKDVLDNFTRRAEAQVDMVDSAVAKDDIDFIPKMEVLVQKDAIAQETVDAVKQLLELKVSEEKGITYDQWVQQGQTARAEKIGEIRRKLEEFNKNIKKKEVEQKQATYRETLKEVGMDEKEIENTLKIEREFGLDIEQSEFINEFVSKSTGEKFTYNTDLAGKYTEDIESSIKTAKEAYKKLQNTTMANPPQLESAKEELQKINTDLSNMYGEDGKGDIEQKIWEKYREKTGNQGDMGEELGKFVTEMIEKTEKATISKKETPENPNTPEKPDNGKQEEKPVEKTQKTEIKDISEKAIAVVGDTMEIKDKLKEIGGKWNPKYKGWIFSKKRRAEVEKVIYTIDVSLEEFLIKEIKEIKEISDGTIYFSDGKKGELTMGEDWGKPQIIGIEVPNKRQGMGRKIIDKMKEWAIITGKNEIRLNNNVSPIFWEKMGFKGEGANKQYDTKWIASEKEIKEIQNLYTNNSEYDNLESSDIFQKVINPYLYEGKKQVPKEVREPKSGGSRQSSTISDTTSVNDSKEMSEKTGTSKKSIVNALDKVEEEFNDSKEEKKNGPTFAEIDRKAAMEASRGTSFDPEKRGEQRIRGFKIEMEELYNDLLQYAKTEEQQAILNEEVTFLSEKLASKQNEINRAESGVVSSMIAGPARFPVERMRKKNEAIQKKYEDYSEFKERAKNAIIKKLKGQETEAVGGPIEALKLEIKKMTEYRDLAKKINAIIKKEKTQEKIYEALIKDGVGEELAKEASTPLRHSGKIETIMLTNLNNKIKDREAKLAKMEKMEQVKGTEDEVKELYKFAGGKVVDNRGADRVQIIFDERPTSDVMYDLKKRGWKWSPKNEAWQRFRNSGSVRVAREMFPEVETKKYQSTELSTKILEKLGNRETISKEFIRNLTNSGDVKQVEKELIRELLETEGETIDVKKFKEKVQVNLLPLNRVSSIGGEPKYEFVTLPESIRGDVQDYSENVYESPIKVSAGKIHFGDEAEYYFGHTRIEDMADERTRRVIEVQSDLYQKGRLDQERMQKRAITDMGDKELVVIDRFGNTQVRNKGETQRLIDERDKELVALKQYNDPTAHFRMIREEIAKAAEDGIEVLQFPTGETAMKIEGLGNKNNWSIVNRDGRMKTLQIEEIEIGKEITNGHFWVITDVLGDGKFKAVEKRYMHLKEQENSGFDGYKETFDISDKVDTNNPIYKFYEKEVGRYLKNNFNGIEMKDDKGVSWYQIEITPDMQNKVLAFQDETSDSWIYDIIGKWYKIEPLGKQRVDISEAYVEAISLAPKGWEVRKGKPTKENYLIKENGDEVVAYADLENKVIMINENEARKTTAAHETVHAALSELPEQRRKEIIATAKNQWEERIGKDINETQAEEFLAEEFKYYIEEKKWRTKTLFGKIKEFLSKLWNTIKGHFGKDNKIKTFYDDILEGNIQEMKTGVGKKFQSLEDWKAREKEMYDAIDAESFGYKLPPKLGAKYELNMEKEKMPSEAWESFKEFSREALVPIDSVIGDIDKKLKDRLWKFEYEVKNSTIIQEARPILEKLKNKLEGKKEEANYRILDLALKNQDPEVVEYYAEQLGVLEELKELRKILDTIYEESIAVGIDMKYVEEYFPRTVRDATGLMKYLGNTEYGSQIKQAIKLAEAAQGVELTDDEKAVIANKLLRGFKIEGITLTPPGNVKARSIEEINKEINPFYNDSMDSLAIYIQGMNENIEARKLFGKGDNLNSSIGAYVMDLMTQGRISPTEEVVLTRALQSRFAKSKMHAFVQGYRNLAYLTTMGSPISAISQIQDLSFSLYENGFLRTSKAWIRAMFRNSEISRDDLGINAIIHEFTDPSKTQQWVAKVFKAVGLEYMDKVGKETMVNGYLAKLRQTVAKGDMSDIEIFDQNTQLQIAKDLAEGKVSGDIKYILFAKLMQYQPITPSQMPQYYQTSGNGRIVYMLKTYLVKQIDVFRQEAFNDIAEGSKKNNKTQVWKGFKNLIFLATALMFMGATTDAIKNLILNRPMDLTDLLVDNLLKLMGFSKYTVYKVKEGTLSDGILSIVTPPFNFINDVIVDAYDIADDKIESPDKLQSINNIPVGGKLYYWWFGKGADKNQKKREKLEKAGQVKISTAKKKSPFSDSLNFKDSGGAFKQSLNFK